MRIHWHECGTRKGVARINVVEQAISSPRAYKIHLSVLIVGQQFHRPAVSLPHNLCIKTTSIFLHLIVFTQAIPSGNFSCFLKTLKPMCTVFQNVKMYRDAFIPNSKNLVCRWPTPRTSNPCWPAIGSQKESSSFLVVLLGTLTYPPIFLLSFSLLSFPVSDSPSLFLFSIINHPNESA